MSDIQPQDKTATYSWYEAVERIASCDSKEELELLCEVLQEEKKRYALFFLKLIVAAVNEQRKILSE
jgi:hypothetical protein